MSSVRTITRVIAKVGCEEVVQSLVRSLLYPTREEPGCLHYEFWQGPYGRNLVTVGEWKDEASVMAHLRSAHVDEFTGEVADYLEHPLEMHWYRLVEEERLSS
ncbi:MAG TPA: antibiotic biosynthesis monooxygenase [Trichocoleus sp.]